MEIEMDKPAEKKPRWMNDNDLNKPLVLEAVNNTGAGEKELIFSTPLAELVRRTTSVEKSEYAFIYNNVQDGIKVFKYVKENGFRTPRLP